MTPPEVSIIIPSLNARDLLEGLLPGLTRVVRNHSRGAEIIVVDDGSTDGTSPFVQATYPDVHLIRSDLNRGFGRSCNLGVSHAKAKILFFLNTDVEATEDFLEPIAKYFEEPDVFGVRVNVVHSLQKESSNRVVVCYWELRYGLIRASHAVFEDKKQAQKECAHVGGSHGAISREKFLELGGFDELYSPIYMEDVDLSYRALKRGWKIYYEPRSLIIHKGGGTMKRLFKKDYTDLLGERNQYFFVWKNIRDRKILFSHFCWLPIRLLRALLTGNLVALKAFFLALARTRDVLKRRRLERPQERVTDREIFQKFGKPRP